MERSVIRGKAGGFLVTGGRPRLATLEGQTYVVGRGQARPVADMAVGRKLMDELLAGEKAAAVTKRAAARVRAVREAAAVVAEVGLLVGRVVTFQIDDRTAYGRVTEIGPRAVRIARRTDTYLRAAGDIVLQPEGDYCDTCCKPCPGHQCCERCAELEVRP